MADSTLFLTMRTPQALNAFDERFPQQVAKIAKESEEGARQDPKENQMDEIVEITSEDEQLSKPFQRFKAKLLELKEWLLPGEVDKPFESLSQVSATPETQAPANSTEKINVVEAMLAEVPNLSDQGKEKIRQLFPDGKVCCPIKVARAIQLELLRENAKGQIKLTA
jgi:hypothetical protein